MTIIPMDIAQDDTTLLPDASMWLRILVDVDDHIEAVSYTHLRAHET